MNTVDGDRELARILRHSPRSMNHISRRELLRRAGIGAGALSASALLAACGIGSEAERTDGEKEAALTTTEKTGELVFANWPAYIDKAKGESPTLLQFEEQTGIDVSYEEDINDNLSFFSRIREPLANDQSSGYDIIVVTDWLIAKMIGLGYLEKLDHSHLENFATHAGEIYKDPSYDPNNAHSVPWQSGITGIAYNLSLTKREITSVEDLFDPQFEGQVGMMTEMRDTMNLVMLGMGIDPETASIEDAEAAQQKLLDQREEGIVRKYYGNDYVGPLASGDLALTMAWSGDVLGKTIGNPDIKFAVPEEGGILWVDNMAIPEGAEHPIDAHLMMDFVYQPEIAAQMTAWINYISPVPEAQDILKDAKDSYTRKVASSPLVFPTPDMEARLHHYKNLTPEEEEQWNEFFDEVVQG
ncbi:MAG: spermidine/putrescine ABC transporter substrate-binding protein [Actinomycetota bacterium]|nr:spermidine/putrescine ABC transporter substrate-binding protein [Actinomycetota bacterium]